MRYLWAIVAVTLIKVTPLGRRYYKRMRINREVRDACKDCVNPRRNEGSWTVELRVETLYPNVLRVVRDVSRVVHRR